MPGEDGQWSVWKTGKALGSRGVVCAERRVRKKALGQKLWSGNALAKRCGVCGGIANDGSTGGRRGLNTGSSSRTKHFWEGGTRRVTEKRALKQPGGRGPNFEKEGSVTRGGKGGAETRFGR